MKISTDLRTVIRATHSAQQNESYDAKRNRTKSAIANLIKRPKYAARIERALKQAREARKLQKAANETFNALGINESLDRICDEAQFRKAGGKISETANWCYNHLIAELANAKTQKEGERILQRIGIQWH